MYSLSGATWLTVIIFSKTVCKYSHFLLLELKNIVSILECVLPKLNIEESCLLAILVDQNQCRSKGNITGGHASAGGARKFWNLDWSLEMLFPAFSRSYLWFTHIANYLLRTLSQQTNAHSEYNTCNVNYKIENRLSISVSWNQQMFHLSESS